MYTSPPNSQVHNRGNPKVTWLVCAHFSSNALKVALQSCLDQTFPDFELLVVANGAKAHEVVASVEEWFDSDPRVRILSTPICHLTFSLSLGAHYARGEFIARMDADDIAYSDRLDKQYEFFVAHPEVVVLGTAYDVIDVDGFVVKTIYPPQLNRDIKRMMLFGNPICHPSVMIRREVLLNAGGYLGGLQAEDYDLWLRLSADLKFNFANLSDVCMGYRALGTDARGSRLAYASQGSAQFRHFLLGYGLRWMFASGISYGKVIRFKLQKLLELDK